MSSRIKRQLKHKTIDRDTEILKLKKDHYHPLVLFMHHYMTKMKMV